MARLTWRRFGWSAIFAGFVVAALLVLFVPARGDGVPVSALGGMLPNTAPDLAGTVVADHTLTVDGTARSWRSITPVRTAGRLPLLVVLAGRGEGSWTVVRTTGFLPLARQGRAVLVYPDGVGRSWNAGGGCCGLAGRQGTPDVAFVSALIDRALTTLPADRARVYLAGYSNGGKLAHAVSCAAPRLLAGVATYGAVPLATCPAASPVPVLLAAGRQDTILPFGGAPRAHPPTAPVPAAAADLAARNGCVGSPATAREGTATVSRWGGCAAPVALAVFPASDHTWPPPLAGLMWDFLSADGRSAPTPPGTRSPAVPRPGPA